MEKKPYKIWFDTLLIILAVILTMPTVVWLYFAFGLGEKPETITTTYVNTVTDSQGRKKPFMEMNYYTNANNTGKEMWELLFNFYTDIELNEVKSYGVQYFDGKYYYYESSPDYFYSAITELKRNTPMIVEINGQVYIVKLTGTYDYIDYYIPWWKFIFLWGASILSLDKETKTAEYTWTDFFEEAKSKLTTTSAGYGKYNLRLVDLAKYFSLEKFDEKTKQFYSIGKESFNMNFFSVSVNKSRYGVVYASQSLFGMVANDANYNASKISDDAADYWNSNMVYTLTLNEFDKRQSIAFEGYLISIKQEVLDLFSKFENIKFKINLILTDNQVVGIDRLGLAGVKVESITINKTTSTLENFIILDDSIELSQVSSNLNLIRGQ